MPQRVLQQKVEKSGALRRTFGRLAYSLGFLLAQHSTQTLNVARYDGQRDVSLEAHDPVIRTQVQAMLLQRIDR